MSNQVQKPPFTEDILKRLLYAVCNVGGDADPETDEGIIFSEAALLMASRLFPTEQELRTQMVKSGYGKTQEQRDDFNPLCVAIDSDAVNQGFIKAMELWLECLKADNPVDHAKAEIKKGLNGERVE